MRKDTFNPNTSDFLEKSIKNHGNISALAKEYNVDRTTIYEYFRRNPQAKEIREKSQNFNTEHDLDLAEQVLRFNMENHLINPGLAQKAAEKVIDKKGHLRGWGVPVDQGVPRQEDITNTHEFMKAHYRADALEKENEELKRKVNELQSKANSEFQRSY